MLLSIVRPERVVKEYGLWLTEVLTDQGRAGWAGLEGARGMALVQEWSFMKAAFSQDLIWRQSFKHLILRCFVAAWSAFFGAVMLWRGAVFAQKLETFLCTLHCSCTRNWGLCQKIHTA
jgi:hypothetical protein